MVQQYYPINSHNPVSPALYRFCHELRYEQIPTPVRERLNHLLLDLLGVLAAGHQTQLSQVSRDIAVAHFNSLDQHARLPFDDGRTCSVSGAALAIGMSIDAYDAHDGYRPSKGHAGCAALAACLALAEQLKLKDPHELLCWLAIGYEVGSRAGQQMHESPISGSQYHASGSWVALATAAITARALRLDEQHFLEAMSIAEYHGPRGLMMKVVNHPSMLKDSSGWGAMAGVNAAYFAKAGFTGSPSAMLDCQSEHLHLWQDLGTNWLTLQQYVKPIAVCRWAQPALYAAQSLQADQHDLASATRLVVHSFEAATRLNLNWPANTEQAQYSLRYPLAVLISEGSLSPEAILQPQRYDTPSVRACFNAIEFVIDAAMDAQFPAQRFAKIEAHWAGEPPVISEAHTAKGDPESMLSPAEFEAKFAQAVPQRVDVISSVRALEHPELITRQTAWHTLRHWLYPT